jgi:hypothetical protein
LKGKKKRGRRAVEEELGGNEEKGGGGGLITTQLYVSVKLIRYKAKSSETFGLLSQCRQNEHKELRLCIFKGI